MLCVSYIVESERYTVWQSGYQMLLARRRCSSITPSPKMHIKTYTLKTRAYMSLLLALTMLENQSHHCCYVNPTKPALSLVGARDDVIGALSESEMRRQTAGPLTSSLDQAKRGKAWEFLTVCPEKAVELIYLVKSSCSLHLLIWHRGYYFLVESK